MYDFPLFLERAPCNSESNVLFDGKPRENPIVLKNKDPSGIRTFYWRPLNKNISRRLFQETGNDIKQGRLPASGRTDNANKLARQDLQIDGPENFNRGSTSLPKKG